MDNSTSSPIAPQNLVKSKKRVADHGEVFTPAWLVEQILDLVTYESERIDSRFLEPACGSGNFLTAVLARKLATVDARYGANAFEQRHHALLALMSVYGIEILDDNSIECREILHSIFIDFLKVRDDDPIIGAAKLVLSLNIVNGDAMTMLNAAGQAIIFPEWAYTGKGRFQRRDFRFETLTQISMYGEGTIFESVDPQDLFTAEKEFPILTVEDLAAMNGLERDCGIGDQPE